MKKIELTNGKVALVDDQDFELLSGSVWHRIKRSSGLEYAERGSPTIIGGNDYHLMHRIILCAPPNMMVDHVDGNGLNNQRSNIRLATCSQNHSNRRFSGNASGFKGVVPFGNKWRAMIKKDRKSRHIGLFDDAVSAAKAYDEMAIKLFGEFARTNASMSLYALA